MFKLKLTTSICRHEAICVLFSLVSLLAMACPNGSSENIKTAQKTKEIGLLKGRLVVKMPKEAKSKPRGFDIMSAPQPDESETRIVFESADGKLVLMATDLYAYASDDFSQGVDRLLKQWQDPNQPDSKEPDLVRQPGIITTAGGLKAVLVKNVNASSKKSKSLLVRAAVVANNDGTVQYLAIYANHAAAKEWSRVSNLAEQILKSAAPGTSPTKFNERTVTVSEHLGLSIKVPESTSVSIKRGPDFSVFRCSKMIPLGDSPVCLIIYEGNHPDFRPDTKAKLFTGTILGQKVDWFEMNSEDGAKGAETILPLPTREDIVLHISVLAGEKSSFETMKKAAESLAVTNPKASAYEPFEKAMALASQGKHREAIVQYNLTLESAPNDAAALSGVARSQSEIGDYHSAVDAYSRIISLKPSVEVLIERAKIYEKLGKMEKAIADLNQAIALDRKDPVPYATLGLLHLELKHHAAAIEDFTQAIDLAPEESPSCLLLRAAAYRAMGKYNLAVEDCTKAIKIRGAAEFYDERALNLEKLGKNERAQQDRAIAEKIRNHTFTEPPSNNASRKGLTR
jgi:tetratricopeptide (TPR) repeat protein